MNLWIFLFTTSAAIGMGEITHHYYQKLFIKKIFIMKKYRKLNFRIKIKYMHQIKFLHKKTPEKLVQSQSRNNEFFNVGEVSGNKSILTNISSTKIWKKGLEEKISKFFSFFSFQKKDLNDKFNTLINIIRAFSSNKTSVFAPLS